MGENWVGLGKTEWEKEEAVQPVLLQGGEGGKEGVWDLGSWILNPSRVPSASACAFITFQLLYEILQIRFISMH